MVGDLLLIGSVVFLIAGMALIVAALVTAGRRSTIVPPKGNAALGSGPGIAQKFPPSPRQGTPHE